MLVDHTCLKTFNASDVAERRLSLHHCTQVEWDKVSANRSHCGLDRPSDPSQNPRKPLCSFGLTIALPNWGTMTEESQATVKKVGLISGGGLLLHAFSKMLLPLALVGCGSYFT